MQGGTEKTLTELVLMLCAAAGFKDQARQTIPNNTDEPCQEQSVHHTAVDSSPEKAMHNQR